MKHTFLVCVLILAAAVAGSAQTIFYYPHVVNGESAPGVSWKTTILLTNPAPPNAPPVTASVEFTRDNSTVSGAGAVFALTFIDEGGRTVSSGQNFTLGGSQTKKFTTTGTGTFVSGFATVRSLEAPLAGTAIFSAFVNGNLVTEAGVNASPAVTRQAIFVDTQRDYKIGVAYANPGPTTDVTLTLLNADAALIVTTTRSLGAGNHTAKFLSELFIPAPGELTGTMVIESPNPLVALALRADPTFSLYTSLQPVTLASLFRPAFEWMHQRAWTSPFTSIARLMSNLPFRIPLLG